MSLPRTTGSVRALLAGLALLAPAAAGALEAVPAWGGRFVPGEATEVAVRLTSPAGGEALLRVEGDAVTVEHRLPVEAGRPVATNLPVWPGGDGRLRLSVDLPGGERQGLVLTLVPRPAPFEARVLSEAGRGESGDGEAVAAAELPRQAAGYRPVAALTLDPVALAALDREQTAALAQHLAACGALILPGANPAVLERVRAASGCGGRGVTTGEPPTRAWDLPPDARLAERLPAGGEGPAPALLLLPYPLLLLGLALHRRSGAWLLLLPPTAALVWAGALPQSVPAGAAVTCAEALAGDGAYRSVTLVRGNGHGAAARPLHLPAAAGVPRSEPDGGTIGVTADGASLLAPPIGLLARRDWRLEGAGVLPFRLGLDTEGGGLRIHNAGPEPSPAGWLLAGGRAAPVPALVPGETQEVGREALHRDPPADLATDPGPGPALLLPHPPPPGLDPRIRAEGWLLVRGADPAASQDRGLGDG